LPGVVSQNWPPTARLFCVRGRTALDAVNQVTAVTDPLAHTTTDTLDHMGRVTAEKNALTRPEKGTQLISQLESKQ
jgi:YD repeat-containing protein